MYFAISQIHLNLSSRIPQSIFLLVVIYSERSLASLYLRLDFVRGKIVLVIKGSDCFCRHCLLDTSFSSRVIRIYHILLKKKEGRANITFARILLEVILIYFAFFTIFATQHWLCKKKVKYIESNTKRGCKIYVGVEIKKRTFPYVLFLLAVNIAPSSLDFFISYWYDTYDWRLLTSSLGLILKKIISHTSSMLSDERFRLDVLLFFCVKQIEIFAQIICTNTISIYPKIENAKKKQKIFSFIKGRVFYHLFLYFVGSNCTKSN